MKNKGFTLVELLSVIVILAIILLIAVPNILGVIDKSKSDTFFADSKMIMKQIKWDMLSNNNLTGGNISDLSFEGSERYSGSWAFDSNTNLISLTNLSNGTYLSANILETDDKEDIVIEKVGSAPEPVVASDPDIFAADGYLFNLVHNQ